MILTTYHALLQDPRTYSQGDIIAGVFLILLTICALWLIALTLSALWSWLATFFRPQHHRGRARPVRGPFTRDRRIDEQQRRIGKQGELLVARVLEDAALRGHCYVFNNVREPSAGDIDHLVVGAGGVTIVETKANGGVLSWDGRPDSPILINGAPMKRDPMLQMQRQTRAFERRFSYRPKSEGRGARPLTEVLGGEGKHWMWCFTRARLPGNLHSCDPHLASPKNLVAKILSQPALFSVDEIDYIAGRIGRAYAVEPDAAPSGPATSGAPTFGNPPGAAPGGRGNKEDRVHGPGPWR